MRDQVAQSCDHFPWCIKLVRGFCVELLGNLANDLQLHQDRALYDRLLQKDRFIETGCIFSDFLACSDDQIDVDVIVFHR